MPVDPQIQRLLDLRAKLPPLHSLSVADARAQMAARPIEGLRIPAVAAVADRDMQGPGGSLPLRIYTPPGSGPFPLMVFFHGSGFVVCDLDTHDAMCRNLCAGTGCVVVSVAGDSAGGNLAAVAALRARDEGGPPIAAQLLIYPVTDYHDPGTQSMAENAEGYGLTRKGMEWFWGHYLADPSHAAHPHACPLKANDLSRLPRAYTITAEYDPLRDEAELYAAALSRAGVPSEMRRWDGMNHGFFFFPGLVGKASEAMDDACAWVRRAVG